jgi:cytidylate kinase
MKPDMDARGRCRVITISATYGAGSTVIGPEVARRLQLPYLGRIVSPAVARGAADRDGETSMSAEERRNGVMRRLFESLAMLPAGLVSTMPPAPDLRSDERIHAEVEDSIRRLAEETGGVIVGRAATLVLRGRTDTLHVRLDGPVEARIARAAQIEHIAVDEARRRQLEVDRVRALYVRRCYDTDIAEPTLYHLSIDTTALSLAACTELVVQTAGAFGDP